MRNLGFVNCEWKINGNLTQTQSSKIYADGRTFDNKFYTFKECNYLEMWKDLQIKTTKLGKKASYNLAAAANSSEH